MSAKTSGGDVRSIVAANAVIDRLLGLPDEEIPDYVKGPLRNELKAGILAEVEEKSALNQLRDKFTSVIRDTRGIGLIQGLYVQDWKGDADIMTVERIARNCFESGVFLRNNKNVLLFKAPAVITPSEIREAGKRIQSAIAKTISEGK